MEWDDKYSNTPVVRAQKNSASICAQMGLFQLGTFVFPFTLILPIRFVWNLPGAVPSALWLWCHVSCMSSRGIQNEQNLWDYVNGLCKVPKKLSLETSSVLLKPGGVHTIQDISVKCNLYYCSVVEQRIFALLFSLKMFLNFPSFFYSNRDGRKWLHRTVVQDRSKSFKKHTSHTPIQIYVKFTKRQQAQYKYIQQDHNRITYLIPHLWHKPSWLRWFMGGVLLKRFSIFGGINQSWRTAVTVCPFLLLSCRKLHSFSN